MGRVTAKKLKEIADVYEKKGGNIHATCEACHISRTTFYNYVNKSPAFKDRLEAIDEAVTDLSISKLMEKINEGDRESIFFWLKTKGANRGFGMQQNVKLSGTVKTQQVTKADIEDKIKKVIALNKAQETELTEEELLKEIEADD